MNSLTRLNLPLGWNNKIKEAFKRRHPVRAVSDSENETSAEDTQLGPIGFGSQESLFSIQEESDSQENSELT